MREDLTGKQFGSWKVIEYAGDRKWLCECQCSLHTRREVLASSLKRGSSICCGNKKEHPNNSDLSGTQIGELSVLRYLGDSVYECQCSCGKILQIETKQLKRRNMLDCGHVVIQAKQPMRPKEPKTYGDWTVVKQVDTRRYLCKCICGYTKEMSVSALWNANKNNYRCKHVKIIGRTFGQLEVLNRIDQKQTLCKCLACGNTVTISLGNLLNGSTTSCGCVKATPTYSREEILKVIEDYVNKHNCKPKPLELKDLLGLGETATYENIKRYNLEQYLDRYSSLGESEVAEIFKDLEVIRHDRKILKGLELDIYIPSLKLAIEYNGSFWHSDDRKDKTYHQNKTILCAKKGIHLIHIFDFEWENSVTKTKLTNYLKDMLNKTNLYGARKLDILEISNNGAKEFYEKYHLQGYVNSTVNIALVLDSEVISAMSFSKPRFDSSYEWELTRYCVKSGVGVQGGAERLLKCFKDRYKPESIITYVDISKFTGNVYTRLGFKPCSKNFITQPNYVWVDRDLNTIQRYNTQKHKLIAKGLGTPDQTEDEIMTTLGYLKIYNSGNLKLELKEM